MVQWSDVLQANQELPSLNPVNSKLVLRQTPTQQDLPTSIKSPMAEVQDVGKTASLANNSWSQDLRQTQQDFVDNSAADAKAQWEATLSGMPQNNLVFGGGTYHSNQTGGSGGGVGGGATGENGKLDLSTLGALSQGGGHKLAKNAANAWNQMVLAAQKDGVNLRVTDSYRDYAGQVDVAKRKGLYKNGGLAATPGKSNHGLGIAVDGVTSGGAKAWMDKNGARFGWHTNRVPRESWHWEYAP